MSRHNCHSEVFRRILLQSPGEIAAYRGAANQTLPFDRLRTGFRPQGDCTDSAALVVREAGLFHAPSGAARMGGMGVR
jgi:hypothetical protein